MTSGTDSYRPEELLYEQMNFDSEREKGTRLALRNVFADGWFELRTSVGQKLNSKRCTETSDRVHYGWGTTKENQACIPALFVALLYFCECESVPRGIK